MVFCIADIVTRFGYFWKVWMTIFLTKEAQTFGNFLASLEITVCSKIVFPGIFFFIFIFSLQLTVNVQNKFLLMTGFEPLTSGIGSDHSTNWATTTAHTCVFKFNLSRCYSPTLPITDIDVGKTWSHWSHLPQQYPLALLISLARIHLRSQYIFHTSKAWQVENISRNNIKNSQIK